MQLIAQRDPKIPFRHFLSFNLVFLIGMLSIHFTQCLLLPVALLPYTRKKVFAPANRYFKTQYAMLLVALSQGWAPTKVVWTQDDDVASSEGSAFSQKGVQVDMNGQISLSLPDRHVIISNHQIYTDWIYIWSLLYLAKIPDSFIIILKASLKWVPLVGPAMQMFQFIFLARHWAEDQKTLSRKLTRLGAKASASNEPLSLMVFPEGTLVSNETRALSRKFADKAQMTDLTNLLLPRSTGLLFCLRALATRVPNLQLVELTIGYEGIDPSVSPYGQDYYTIQSTFGHAQPPPAIHVHYQCLPVESIPIGEINTVDATEEEKRIFGEWLLKRWQEKDERMGYFYTNGKFKSEEKQTVLPIELKDGDMMWLWISIIPGLYGVLWATNWVLALCGF